MRFLSNIPDSEPDPYAVQIGVYKSSEQLKWDIATVQG
jgi:hypothetical protein